MSRDAKNAEVVRFPSRRRFLRQSTMGLGSLALASMLHETSAGQDLSLGRPPHFAPKARSAIWLFMAGGASHVDTFDYKPELQRRHGQRVSAADGRPANGRACYFGSPFRFRQHGQSGSWVSDIFPHTAKHVDDIAFLHSVYSLQNDHAPASIELMTGTERLGYPCLGSWLSYGLGTVNENLPAFVVMHGESKPRGFDSIWSSGFLPKSNQPLTLNARLREQIADLARLQGMSDAQQRAQLELLRQFNQEHHERHPLEADLAGRIQSFELAYRMQTAAPEALDVRQEPEHVQEMYGLNHRSTETFGRQCLLARRLVERGVRFVQIFFTTPAYAGEGYGGVPWDAAHDGLQSSHQNCADSMDQPMAALLADLKYRGLLDSTLVICGGEFGRTVDDAHENDVMRVGCGRDHNLHANTIWMAGGGVRGGVHYGATDQLGRRAVENRVGVNDIGATILHLFGIDHTRLTYRFNSRDFRLTDVAGNVIQEILA